MKKKKKPASQFNLSPENYIKTRARNLPIHKCIISDNWKESKFPTILVSRLHSNGNVSACIYTIELQCMGVVFTDFVFNMPENELMEVVDQYFLDIYENTDYAEIEYTLAHNIIYSGIEYATEWGIPEHKKLHITREFIEKDNDTIEFIDIECGVNGKPVFCLEDYRVFFKGDPEVIIRKLEKHPGPGNYEIISEIDASDNHIFKEEDDEDDELDFDDDDYEPELLKEYTEDEFELDKKNFILYAEKLTHGLKDDEYEKLGMAVERLRVHLADNNSVIQNSISLFNLELDEIAVDSLPKGFLSIENLTPRMEKNILELLTDFMSDSTKPRENIKRLQKYIGDHPFIEYIGLVQDKLEDKKPVTIEHKLQKALMEFPDYPLLQMYHYTQLDEQSGGTIELPEEYFRLSNFFKGREAIHIIELQAYVVLLVNYFAPRYDLEKLIALEDFLFEQILPDDLNAAFGIMLMAAKIVCIKERLKDLQGKLNRV